MMWALRSVHRKPSDDDGEQDDFPLYIPGSSSTVFIPSVMIHLFTFFIAMPVSGIRPRRGYGE